MMPRFLNRLFCSLLLAFLCGAGMEAHAVPAAVYADPGAKGISFRAVPVTAASWRTARQQTGRGLDEAASFLLRDMLPVQAGGHLPVPRAGNPPLTSGLLAYFPEAEMPSAFLPLPVYRYRFSVATSDCHRFLFRLTPF